MCPIKQSDSYNFEKQVANCEGNGGLATIIYKIVKGPLFTLSTWCKGNIPGAFISRADGKYLANHGLGEVVTMAVTSSTLLFGKDPNSRRIYLPERKYKFIIYDNGGDGICCGFGHRHYNVTSNDALIVQSGDFGKEEAT